MTKRVLVLTTSARRGGNTDKLAQAFAKGVEDAGNTVRILRTAEKRIEPCQGCLSCQQTHRCAIRDDMQNILEAMMESDVICFATPIYFYEISGRMKTLLDRTNPIFPQDYPFRDIYLLTVAADTAMSACRRAVSGLEGWVECFPETRLRQVIFAPGVTHIGDMEALAQGREAMKTAFEAPLSEDRGFTLTYRWLFQGAMPPERHTSEQSVCGRPLPRSACYRNSAS